MCYICAVAIPLLSVIALPIIDGRIPAIRWGFFCRSKLRANKKLLIVCILCARWIYSANKKADALLAEHPLRIAVTCRLSNAVPIFWGIPEPKSFQKNTKMFGLV